jgi:hypothetical protein
MGPRRRPSDKRTRLGQCSGMSLERLQASDATCQTCQPCRHRSHIRRSRDEATGLRCSRPRGERQLGFPRGGFDAVRPAFRVRVGALAQFSRKEGEDHRVAAAPVGWSICDRRTPSRRKPTFSATRCDARLSGSVISSSRSMFSSPSAYLHNNPNARVVTPRPRASRARTSSRCGQSLAQ